MALWFGNKMLQGAFLYPTIDQLNELQNRGIAVHGIIYQVRPLIISVDTVARPVLRNTTQFNGHHGCDFCLHRGTWQLCNKFYELYINNIFLGKRVKKGSGTSQSYPQGCISLVLRTLEQLLRDKIIRIL
jgi:hypothetical protein